MWEPAVAAGAVLAAVYLYRVDFARYSIFTIGVFRRINREVVTGDEYECVDDYCEESTELAERRRWFKELVVLGMPVVRYGGGTHHYCEAHASFEVAEDFDDPLRPMTQRVTLSVAGVIAGIAGTIETPDTDDSPFDNVQAGPSPVADAFTLLPVVFLVLFAAIAVSIVRGPINTTGGSDSDGERQAELATALEDSHL